MQNLTGKETLEGTLDYLVGASSSQFFLQQQSRLRFICTELHRVVGNRRHNVQTDNLQHNIISGNLETFLEHLNRNQSLVTDILGLIAVYHQIRGAAADINGCHGNAFFIFSAPVAG